MKLRSVLMPVPALDPALRCLRDTLAVSLRFADGARYAAFDSRLCVALAAGDERIADTPALVVRVDDLDAALARFVADGADVRRAAHDGPHERRAVITAAGLAIVLSQPHCTGA
jgi:hypothetical protein